MAAAAARNVSVEQVVEAQCIKRRTRREFLKAAALTAGAVALGRRAAPANAATAPRLVVVGAGLAGLTCAYRLKQAGYSAQVYEASERAGGRCWTMRGVFNDGQIAEHGVDWINETVPGGINSKLGQLLDVAYNIEYGAESNTQSSLNLLYLLGYSGQGQLRIVGPSNEKYHVRGGNDQIPARLADALSGQIQFGQELIAIKRDTAGTYTLTFKSGRRTTSVTADKVVLALPFSILRASVDYRQAGFSSLKQVAIQEMGMGTNSKLHLQFTDRHWEALGSNGETFADTGYQNTRDVTRAQSGRAGILVNYTGGNIGASFNSGTPTTRAREFLRQVEPVLPGVSTKWNGIATLDYWTGYPWTRGSYSYWKVEQYTRFAGIEGRPEGNCHFAGEHTSIDFQGYLNGAVETGERAANEILADL